MKALDRLRLWKNTLVVFFGDHGYHLGERGWWNKSTLFELSARAPLIVAAPRIKAKGKATTGIVEFLDIYPTIVDKCGLPTPDHLQGTSFRRVLDDPGLAGKKAAYTQVQRGEFAGRSVRTERWRYTEWDDGRQGVELYNHSNDPGEYYNLAEKPEVAGIVADLKALLYA
jgi:uncharacterized sulfatase